MAVHFSLPSDSSHISRSHFFEKGVIYWAGIGFLLLASVSTATPAIAQSVDAASDGVGSVVTQNGQRFDITGGAISRDGQNAFHSFERFGLTQEQTANFIANPDVLNILSRVVGGDPSIINGQITLTGTDANLFLVNPAGVFFGDNAQLNVPASFTATTATSIEFEDGWFDVVGTNDYSSLGGTPDQFVFKTDTPGPIFNAGYLSVEQGHTLSLMGGQVTSVGDLAADGGTLLVAAVPGQSIVSFRPEGHVLGLGIHSLDAWSSVNGNRDINLENLRQWTLPVASLPEVLTGGLLDHASSVTVNPDGTMALESGYPIAAEPESVNVAGRVDGSSTTTVGGTVAIAASAINLLAADIRVDGATGGGTIQIGGAPAGSGDFPRSDRTYLSSGTTVTADALEQGHGGTVILYSDDTTGFFGDIRAQGGSISGDGGFVEVSGRQNLIYQGTVNTNAANGQPGTVLIDPENIVIVAGTRNPGVDGVNTFTGELTALDNPGETTTLFQSDVEAIAGNIILEATNDITIEPLENGRLVFAAGGNSITFRADADGDTEGDFAMNPTDTLFTNGNDLTIEGVNLTLGNVNSLMAGNVFADNPNELSLLEVALTEILFEGNGGLLGETSLQDVVRGDIQLSASGAITTGVLETRLPSEFQTALVTAGERNETSLRINPEDAGVVTVAAAGDVLIDAIDTSSPVVGGSDVTVEADGDVEIGTIDTSALPSFGTGEGPIVIRRNPGGNVAISGDRVRLTGKNVNDESITTEGFSNSITTENPDSEFPTEGELTNGSGIVTITHRGGSENESFVVGDASSNGTAGAINTGERFGVIVTPDGTEPFPVTNEDPGVLANGSDRVTITSINTAPTLTGTVAVETTAETPIIISLASLVEADVDNDNTVLRITNIADGAVLTVDGEPLTEDQEVSADAQIVYTPNTGDIGIAEIFQVVASDTVSDSAPIPVTVAIAATPTPDPTPSPTPDPTPPPRTSVGTPPPFTSSDNPDEPENPDVPDNPEPGDPTNPPNPPTPSPEDTPLTLVLNPSVPPIVTALEVETPNALPTIPPVEFYTVNPLDTAEQLNYFVGLEQSFSNDFVSYLNLSPVTGLSSTSIETTEEQELESPETASQLAHDIEVATGERPGFVYISFVPAGLEKSLNLNQLEPQNSDELELVVITARGGMIRRRVPGVTRNQVIRMAQAFRQDITTPTRSATRHLAESQQLYRWLVAPIQDQLDLHGITNLSFLADEGLRTLPYAALYDGEQYLVERYSVGLIPSLSLTNTEYVDVRNASMLAMGVSESTGGQTPLPAVPTELSTLVSEVWQGELFLNENATLDTLKDVRQQTPFGIIHLATHARFEAGGYDESYIQLWDDQLNMDEVRQLGWNNPAVEMLVLSACQTALGSPEAELGFAGLAVQTGVKTAIASLWSVDDTATMSLMTQFYNTLNTAPIKSEALRQAQLALVRGDAYVDDGVLFIQGLNRGIPLPPESAASAINDFSHPYFWSAFTVVGNPW